MRWVALLTAVALLAIYVSVKIAIPPKGLEATNKASSADLKHPPTALGSPAAIAAPGNGKRPRDQSN